MKTSVSNSGKASKKIVAVVLTRDLDGKLNALAERSGESRSAIIRQAVRDLVAKKEEK